MEAAIAFDLIAQDEIQGLGDLEIALWLLIGALIFIGGDRLVESRFVTAGQEALSELFWGQW